MTAQNRTPKRRRKSWEPGFLAALSRSGSVASACQAARIGRRTAYDRRFKDEDFSSRWESALETFADGIEAEAIRRAVKGVVRYRFYKGKAVLHPELCLCNHGRLRHEGDAACQEVACTCSHFLAQPYRERDRSDALLALLLKGLRPDRYRESLGLSAEEVDAFIERRIAELAQERVNQITRNGTIHPSSSARIADPGPAPPVSPPPDGASASAAAGPPAPEATSGPPDPPPFEAPRRPPWMQGELPGENRQGGL
jgi:hypothetical protein